MIRRGKYTKRVSPVRRVKRVTRRHWRWFSRLSKKQKILVIATPILAFLILTPIITYLYYAHDISDQERLMNRNNTGIVLADRNGEIFYKTGKSQHQKLVPLSEIAPVTKDALLSSEDKDFYEHGGFSALSILKALYGNLASGDVTAYGGSTLTQQLAKNTLLRDNQTFFRKYQELVVAIAIEQNYSKDQILEMYLNSVYFGEHAFGIEDAAKTYFNKAPKDLNLAESSMLIGVLPAPSSYSPISGNPTYAKERQTTVLTRMVNNGKITEAEKQSALATPLAYAPVQNVNENGAPHFSEMVIKELSDKYGEEKVSRSGYQVTTTLDLKLQNQMTTNIGNHMSFIQRSGGSNAGGVAIDPTNGEVRALVGSADWNNPEWGKFNIATADRQPGSSFKPIYYSEALAKGTITPATIFVDQPTDFGGGYKPQNASRSYSGDISVRNALARSLNIPSVKVMQKLGTKSAVEAARRMGIKSLDDKKTYDLSLALGSSEVPLTEMTNAYAAFANQGKQYDRTVIKEIKDKFGKSKFKANNKSKQAISSEGAFLISSILSDNAARAPIFGSSLTVPGRTAAVKTGTTDEQRDAWTIGYTPQLAVGIWVGNNNNKAMLNGGSGMAGPIWVNTMKQGLAGVANTQFNVPSGVVKKPVCRSNGGLANTSGSNTYDEYFLSSALPTNKCSSQKEPVREEKPPEPQPETQTTEPSDTTSGDGTDGDDGAGNNGNGNGNGNGNNPGVQLPNLPIVP